MNLRGHKITPITDLTSLRYATSMLIGSVLLICAIHSAAKAASFDCAKARTASEHTICVTPALSAKDEALARVFNQLREQIERQNGDIKALSAGEHRWLAMREACGTDQRCIGIMYDQRIAELTQTLSKPQIPVGRAGPNRAPISRGAPSPQALVRSDDVVAACNPDFDHNSPILTLDDAVRAKRTPGPAVAGGTMFDESMRVAELNAATSKCFQLYLALLRSFMPRSEEIIQHDTAAAAERERQKAEQVRQDTAAGLERAQRQAVEKGSEYAKASGTTWDITRKKNEMTDKVDATVVSIQKYENGVRAEITGVCVDNETSTFTALIVDEQGKPTISFSEADPTNGSISVKIRANESQPQSTILRPQKFSNEFVISELIGGQTGRKVQSQKEFYLRKTAQDASFPLIIETLIEKQGYGALEGNIGWLPIVNAVGMTWRILVQIDTSRGPVIIKIPVYDDAIQGLVKSCG